MKKLQASFVLVFLGACTPAQIHTAETTALTLAQITCIVANMDAQAPAALTTFCGMESALEPLVEKLIASEKAARAKAHVGACK